jgi:hypothetical protein
LEGRFRRSNAISLRNHTEHGVHHGLALAAAALGGRLGAAALGGRLGAGGGAGAVALEELRHAVRREQPGEVRAPAARPVPSVERAGSEGVADLGPAAGLEESLGDPESGGRDPLGAAARRRAERLGLRQVQFGGDRVPRQAQVFWRLGLGRDLTLTRRRVSADKRGGSRAV